MLVLLALLSGTVSLAPVTTAPPRPDLQVQIEVEPDVQLEADVLRSVAAEIARIWKPALDIEVLTASSAQRSRAVDRLRLVVTTHTLDATVDTGLGWIDFVDAAPQPVITVSTTAVMRLMRASAWRGRSFDSLPSAAARLFMQRALARAAAHEIGHYVLRSPQHQKSGLMRAVFTVDEIMGGRRGERLSPAQVHAARRGVELLAHAGISEGQTLPRPFPVLD